jgi:hypothetical protein
MDWFLLHKESVVITVMIVVILIIISLVRSGNLSYPKDKRPDVLEIKHDPKDKRPDVLEIKHDPYVRIILTLCFIVLLMICFKL